MLNFFTKYLRLRVRYYSNDTDAISEYYNDLNSHITIYSAADLLLFDCNSVCRHLHLHNNNNTAAEQLWCTTTLPK